MDIRCRIEMFGGLEVRQGEQTHTRFRTHKAASLLAYLALYPGQSQPRERLLDLLWPDMELATARLNLNTTLTQLRRQLEPVGVPAGSLLITDKQHVRLNPQAIRTDVADFDRLLHQGSEPRTEKEAGDDNAASQSKSLPEKGSAERAESLEQAIRLYRGSLLPGWYEEWVTTEQTRCQVAYQEALRELTGRWEEAGRYSDALALAQKACAEDPYDEGGWQAQMRLLVRLRKPSLALQAYDSLEQRFARDLGARPSARSQKMAELIRTDPRSVLLLRAEAQAAHSPEAGEQALAPSGSAAPPAVREGVSSVPASVPVASGLSEASVPVSPLAAPSLPLRLTRFFGREEQREKVARLLQEPGARLVSLLGPGGAGKTRLALEVAAQVAPRFANRVWFVSLADLRDASLIAPLLLHALRLPPLSTGDPLERVIAHLNAAPSLLVLDNLEHLLRETPGVGKNDNPGMSGCVGLLRLLLERVSGLVCLATSRHPLRIGGEQEYPLPPLDLPSQEDAASPENLIANPCVALYMDRARAARPDFALTAGNATVIAALCRRLEGIPLAIEMAAAWVKTIPPPRMLERLERQLDLLVSRRRDLPPRHQSLRATIEWSYDLLTPPLRRMFVLLGVFRGGWTLEAAEAVCGSGALHALLALQEQSLIVAAEAKDEVRYRMLEPLREFALEKLSESGEEEAMQRAHADYFTDLATIAARGCRGPEVNLWLDRLDAEVENLRSALTWTEEHHCEQAFNLASQLITFWHMRGHEAEGCRRMLSLLSRPEASAPTTLRAWALEGTAHLLLSRGEFAPAQACAEEAAQIWRATENKRQSVSILNLLAMLACDTGASEQACELWREMLPLTRELGMTMAEMGALHNLGETLQDMGQWEQARPLLEEALRLGRAIQDRERMSRTLNILGKTLLHLNAPEALLYLTESLEIRQEINDQPGIVETLETFIDWLAAEGAGERAAMLVGVVQALRRQSMSYRPPNEEAQFADSLSRTRALLSAADYEAAWRHGETLTREQAVQLALSQQMRFDPA